MEIMSAREAANKWGISQRRVALLCSEGRIAQAQMVGNSWAIPKTAAKPTDGRSLRYTMNDGIKVKPFLKWAGGKGQLLSEIEKYYPFSDTLLNMPSHLLVVELFYLMFLDDTIWKLSILVT